MSHLLQLRTVPLLLIIGLGYKEGAAISFRFFLRLQITENLLFGKALFKLHLNVDSECVF